LTVLTSAAALLARPADVLLDVRWSLGDDTGRARYLAGHLPGAVYVDLPTELSAPPSTAEGRHPLPPLQRLQDAARRWGVSAGRRVVAYDDSGGSAAARAWWLLRWGGFADVTLLDGGLAAWTAAGGALETGDVVAPAGDVVLTGGGMPVLDADAAAALTATSGVLLDVRAAERFRGEMEPVDPRAGHVPGAVSAPSTATLGPDGRLLPAAVLTEHFAALGAQPGTPVGIYCGSGVTAALGVAALAEAGVAAALWPGSWSQWSADPARPVATGAR
jgi:thiosulfate/3-mercaptopyruvate sulfurtransferase